MKKLLFTVGLVGVLTSCLPPPKAVNRRAAGDEPDATQPLPTPAASPIQGRRRATISIGTGDALDPVTPATDTTRGTERYTTERIYLPGAAGGYLPGAGFLPSDSGNVPPASGATPPRNGAPASTMPTGSPDTMPAPGPGTMPAPGPGTMPVPGPGTMPAPGPGTGR